MIPMPLLNKKRSSTAIALLFLLLVLALTHPTSRSYIPVRLPDWKLYGSAKTNTSRLSVPAEYTPSASHSGFCDNRFSERYLDYLRGHRASYCLPGSHSNLTCFHSHTAEDGSPDSFCLGWGAALDKTSGRFSLDCPTRGLSENETSRGLVPFEQIRGYWYDTGPRVVFDRFVDLDAKAPPPTGELQQRQAEIGARDPPRFYLLLKREGETNPWHCLMEIWSAWMTFDVLRMAADPLRQQEAFFRVPEDVSDTQVVILDDREDGPYLDLWTLFSKRKPVRMEQLLADPTATTTEAGIIVPLAGASNPLWQNDRVVRDCTSATTLRVFVQRVLGFYGTEGPGRDRDKIVVTFIDRKSRRQLSDQQSLLAALAAKVPHIEVQAVDLAALPFSEQLGVARETDVLVGVHGAGLTHTMFMREGVGAVVELQPPELLHNGFRNLAAMMGLNYYRLHGSVGAVGSDSQKSTARKRSRPERRDPWHDADVEVEEDRFLEIVGAAIKSLYTKGAWNYDAA